MRELVCAQRLLRRSGQLRRLPARQARSPALPRPRRVRDCRRRVRVRRRLLWRRALHPGLERRARVQNRMQLARRRLHGELRLLLRSAVHRGAGIDDGSLCSGRTAGHLRPVRANVRPGRRLLQRRSLHGRQRAGVRRSEWLLVRPPANPMTRRAGSQVSTALEDEMGSPRMMPRWIALAALCAHALGCGSDSTSIRAGRWWRPQRRRDRSGRHGLGCAPVTIRVAGSEPSTRPCSRPYSGERAAGPGAAWAWGPVARPAADCCSSDCVGGVCNYPTCTSDRGACTTNGECCSQTCTAGMCAPLNTTCKTLGNACGSGAECCSTLCSNGTCQASSFCGQARGCVLDGIGLLHRRVHDRGRRDARHLRRQPAERAGQLRGRRRPDLRRVRRGRGCRDQRRRVARVRGSLLQPRVRALGAHRGARLPAGERMPRRR